MMIRGWVCVCLQNSADENESFISILIWLLSSEALFSKFTGLGVHWNSLVKTQLGDLIYENSFKPFTTLTNPVQVHWANSKVALSLFIGFQLHQHSTAEPSRWKKYITVTERHKSFFERLKNENSILQTGASRCNALSVLYHPWLTEEEINALLIRG